MNLHKCPSCRSVSPYEKLSFSPQRTRSRPYFNNGNREYLTPANKDDPKCTNRTSSHQEDCYLNPLDAVGECIYNDNWWQANERNEDGVRQPSLCFPKVPDEEITMDDIEPYLLKTYGTDPTDEAIRQEALKHYASLGIIPNIEHQLQETSSIKIPKIPLTLHPKYKYRLMTSEDFDELDYKFGEEVSVPYAMPKEVDTHYTKRDNEIYFKRFVGRNPIPIIEARDRFEEETKQPLTYGDIVDSAVMDLDTSDEKMRKNKKMWENWFLMTGKSKEEKEQARDQPISPFRTSYNRVIVADPIPHPLERIPNVTYSTNVEDQKTRWWKGLHRDAYGNFDNDGVLPINIDRNPGWTDEEDKKLENTPTLLCPICRKQVGRYAACNHITHEKSVKGCEGHFLYEEELIRLRQRLLKHLLEGEAEGKSIERSLKDPLRFEWDRSMNLDTWDDMKRRHEEERAQEPKWKRQSGFLPLDPYNPIDAKFIIEEKNEWPQEMKDDFEDELNRLRKRWLLQENGKFFLDDGSTAFLIATRLGFSDVMKKMLLDKEKDIDVNHASDSEGNTVLMLAAENGQLDVVKMLLDEKKDIDVNVQNNQGHTALLLAIKNGQLDVAKMLLERKETDVNRLNKRWGVTALMLAIMSGPKLDIVEKLLERKDIDVNVRNKFLKRRLQAFFIDSEGNTALMLAAEKCKLDVVKMLLERADIDVNVQNNQGNTALLLATKLGGYFNPAYIPCGLELDVVENLLEINDIDVNVRNNRGNTALMLACFIGDRDIVEKLLERKEIDVNVQNNKGNTALLLATKNGQLDVAKMLLERADIDVNVQNEQGETVLMFAIRDKNSEVVKRLLERKETDVNLQNKWGVTALEMAIMTEQVDVVEMLLQRKEIDVNQVTGRGGETALMLAIRFYSPEVVERLLERKETDVNQQDGEGDTALMMAIMNRRLDIAKMLLQRNDIDLNLQNGEGDTALMMAIMTRQLDIAKMLLQRNDIDLNLQNKQGNTALMLTNKLVSSGQSTAELHPDHTVLLEIIEMWIEFQERITERSQIQ